MNIHEAVLQPIAAFVAVIARQQQAVVGRQKTEISTRQQALAQLNSAHPPMGGVQPKLFYDGTTSEIK